MPSRHPHSDEPYCPWRILVADNDLARQLAWTLTHHGATAVAIATSGEEALAHAAGAKFDLILLNYRMPRKNGAVTLRELRARGDVTPVIMISAWSRDEIPDPIDDLAFDDWIEKPFSSHHLLTRINHSIDRHRAAAGAADGDTT
ncbi:MAG: response regulator transcription factor [Hyphomicrobium sp.]